MKKMILLYKFLLGCSGIFFFVISIYGLYKLATGEGLFNLLSGIGLLFFGIVGGINYMGALMTCPKNINIFRRILDIKNIKNDKRSKMY